MERLVLKVAVLAALTGCLYFAQVDGRNELPPPGPQTFLTPQVPMQSSPPRIEVVFALDTTGSMSGLIHAAKEKIWAIANTLASTEPAPIIKIGLVGYRDRGDAYVTKRTNLTDDLDSIYSKLIAFRADGGGDGPESVNQALHEAVTAFQWSKDDETYRVIFLVGDYPPHMNYHDDVKYPETCKLAAEAGIAINTIQCGAHGATTPIWQDIARRAEGRYFNVEQSGSAILASTPFDAKLAEAARELDKTRIFYGSDEAQAAQRKREKTAGRIYEKASVTAQASRAAFNAGEAGTRNFLGSGNELVDDVANGRARVEDLKKEELPEKMRKMSARERREFVAHNAAKRKGIQERIKKLAARRQAHIENEVRKAGTEKKSLDSKMFDCVKKQAGKKKIIYKGGPSY